MSTGRKMKPSVRPICTTLWKQPSHYWYVIHYFDAYTYYAHINTSYIPMYKFDFDRLFIHTLVILFSQISLVINVFVVAVFASGLHGKTNGDIHAECLAHNNTQGADIFPNNTDLVQADIYKGGVFLGCFFGNDLSVCNENDFSPFFNQH